MNCHICAADLRFLCDKGYVKDGKYYCTHCYKKYVKTGGKRNAMVAQSGLMYFSDKEEIVGSNPTHRTMKIKRRYINEHGEEEVVVDMSKDFKKFIKRNDKLLRELGKH